MSPLRRGGTRHRGDRGVDGNWTRLTEQGEIFRDAANPGRNQLPAHVRQYKPSRNTVGTADHNSMILAHAIYLLERKVGADTAQQWTQLPSPRELSRKSSMRQEAYSSLCHKLEHMADMVKLRWLPAQTSGLSRRDREGCDYEAYAPDRLAAMSLQLDARTAADVAAAELAIAELNRDVRALASSEAIARLLLRAEAVASSRIEGLEVGGRRLLKAQLARDLDDARADITATEVLNNVEAMNWAVGQLSGHARISVADLLAVHERLLAGTRLEQHGGQVRDVQNWIGGSEYNPCSAAFVPPPPEHVDDLLEDLCAFCDDNAIPAVAQAAIAHAQFETIHPFADGNGRAGRALIHVILRRRGLAPRFVPPISLVLATRAADYVAGLTRTRYLGPPDGPDARDGLNDWITFFAAACRRAVADAQQYEQQVAELQQRWRARLGRVRRDSATDLLLAALPGVPVLTVQSAAALIDRSVQAVNEAVGRLTEVGVLTQTTIGKRNRAFEAPEFIDAFTALERQLASPEADTRTSPPGRRVPRRRQRIERRL